MTTLEAHSLGPIPCRDLSDGRENHPVGRIDFLLAVLPEPEAWRVWVNSLTFEEMDDMLQVSFSRFMENYFREELEKGKSFLDYSFLDNEREQ